MRFFTFFIFFAVAGLRAHARVLRLTVRPAVATVSLHSFSGLRETVKEYALNDGRAALPVPVKEGLLTITLPNGASFPLWAAAADTGYTMLLTPASPVPTVTGSAASGQLYRGMAAWAKLQRQRTALAQTRQGLADTALLAQLVQQAQTALDAEADSLYRQLQLGMASPANALLWGGSILPYETERLAAAGREREAKQAIISFVNAHYALAANSNLLRGLMEQYLLATEMAPLPPDRRRYEDRTRDDLAAWANALRGKCTGAQVTNYFIGYFLHRSEWTLCDSLMRGNPDASCPLAAAPGAGQPQKMAAQNALGDSLDLARTKEAVLVALFDMDCPSAVMEYVLLRRKLGEGLEVPIKTAVVLLHQDAKGLQGVWQGMPPAIYHYTGQGHAALAARLPKNARVPGYWVLLPGRTVYVGASYAGVQQYFNKLKGGTRP